MSDTPPRLDAATSQFRPFAELIFSMSFLTRLPIPFARTLDPPPLSQSMRLFAVAGGMIGAINGLVYVGLLFLHVPPLMSAAITLLIGLMINGGLHEDGLADSADGLFGGKTREQRLAIMRDSRIGSYGAMALITCLLARAGALLTLSDLPPLTIIAILAAAASFSRVMVVDLVWATRPARNDGLSVFAGQPQRSTALFAIVTGAALAICAGLLIKQESGVIAVLAAAAVTGLVRYYAIKLIGGQTGDICGATQILTELVMLAVYTAMIY
jgi:adenosylcobinamide-GDP ribazoletransferase